MQKLTKAVLGGVAVFLAWLAPAVGQTVEVVSTPPGLVTTPGVLVRVRGAVENPYGWASNSTLLTPFFKNEDGDWFGWIGLMDLLLPDPKQIMTVVPDGRKNEEIEFNIGVHAPGSPLFEGPRPPEEPCRNEAAGLGAPRDVETCEAIRSVNYVYRNAAGVWAPYGDGVPAKDIARTTTSAGKNLPMIVRVETGVINRAPYVIAILDDPATDSGLAPGQPWTRKEWNGGLVYGAGPGFAVGVQSPTHAGLLDIGSAGTKSCAEKLLEAGYAVLSTDNRIGPDAYDIVAAETLLRAREWFIKRYALPKTTIGIGTGDAAPALTRIAGKYPGLDSVGTGSDPAVAALSGCR